MRWQDVVSAAAGATIDAGRLSMLAGHHQKGKFGDGHGMHEGLMAAAVCDFGHSSLHPRFFLSDCDSAMKLAGNLSLMLCQYELHAASAAAVAGVPWSAASHRPFVSDTPSLADHLGVQL